MDIVQLLAVIIGSAGLSTITVKIIDSITSRRKLAADTELSHGQAELAHAQADDLTIKTTFTVFEEYKKSTNAKLDEFSSKMSALSVHIGTLETLLARSDAALSSLVRDPGIARDYTTEVARAVRIRRGLEPIDLNITPFVF